MQSQQHIQANEIDNLEAWVISKDGIPHAQDLIETKFSTKQQSDPSPVDH